MGEIFLSDVCFRIGSGKGCEERVFWQVCTLTGHEDGVTSVAFAPDGKRVVSASDDGLVKIWDSATGAEVSSVGEVRYWWYGAQMICARSVSGGFFWGRGLR